MASGNVTRRVVDVADRRRRALGLRRAGVSYERIARELGYAGPSGAYKAVRTALRSVVFEPARELVQLELARLDEMQSSLWPKVLSGDPRASRAALAVLDHRAKLTGLYAQKVDLEEYIREVVEVGGWGADVADRAVAEAFRIMERRPVR